MTAPTDGRDDIPMSSAGKVKAKKASWLWHQRLTHGSVNLIAGRSCSGKSTVVAALVADITGGPSLPGQLAARPRGPVLWCSAEENIRTVVIPRLKRSRAKLAHVHFPGVDGSGITRHLLELPGDLSWVKAQAWHHGVKAIVLDPLASYCPFTDLNQQQQVRSLLGQLRALAEDCDLTWICVAHPSKQRSGPILDRLFGSASLVHFCRSVLLVGEHPERDGRRVIVHAKPSEGPPAPTLSFRLALDPKGKAPPCVEWDGECPVTVDDLSGEGLTAGDLDSHIDARDLLRERCRDWRPAKDVLREGLEAGLSERTLRNAKAELKMASRYINDGATGARWEWGPPDSKKKGGEA